MFIIERKSFLPAVAVLNNKSNKLKILTIQNSVNDLIVVAKSDENKIELNKSKHKEVLMYFDVEFAPSCCHRRESYRGGVQC